MVEIKLTQNKICIIDDEDFEKIVQYKWYYMACGYAATRPWDKLTKTYSTIYMHRYILSAEKGMLVDHINGNTLDNRISNLRICSQKENIRNSKMKSSNTSGFRGVFWSKQKNKWMAKITVNYKPIHLGFYADINDAVLAYENGAKKYFGEFYKSQ